ncbi:MAG: hypothetical protein OXG35_22310 [Acidobacteria bacterium]|nr:hypothetical protein [Acidobacteriota bacterium]
MQRVVLALVLASTFVVLSAQPVEAQSRAVQPRAAQPPAAELSQWETATLVRLMNLLEVELTRRSRTGDLVALRRQLAPAGTRQPSSGDARVQTERQDDLPRGTVEGGFSQFIASFENVSVSTTGLYASVSGRFHAHAEVFAAFNRVDDLRVTQLGAQFRASPRRWLARPAFRVGMMYSDGVDHDVNATGGFGVRVGRQYGGSFSADFTSVEGILLSIVHVGGYIGF